MLQNTGLAGGLLGNRRVVATGGALCVAGGLGVWLLSVESPGFATELHTLEHGLEHELAGLGHGDGHGAAGGAEEHVVNFYSTLALAFVAGAISAAGGIGGGGVLVPLYILVAPLSPHGAIPLSKATILGNALCQLVINFPKRHPHRPVCRPLPPPPPPTPRRSAA
jgi:hypothetical protein